MPSNLSLKQRLAALSHVPSASPTQRRKSSLLGFQSPWSRHSHNAEPDTETQREHEMLQDVMGRIIFQAGVDYETRPMVIISAAALPDPREISYDRLLQRVLAHLNLYVESDYTVVFFAAGGRHTPGWNWVWKAYRSLSRKYRKNLKRLVILFPTTCPSLSPKFFRKIEYIETLSELACYVPLTQIDVPRAVYVENFKHESKVALPAPTRSNVFGVPLEELMGVNGENDSIPRVVRDCIAYIRETALQEPGLFRRSPQSVMLRAAQDAYDRGNAISLESFGDPHLAAVLLKKYLRDLPQPIFPERLYPTIRRCPPPTSDASDIAAVSYLRDVLLLELLPCAHILLSHVLHLMHEVSLRSNVNLMDAHNLAIVLCPNLVKGDNAAKDVLMCAVPTTPPPPGPLSEGRTTLGMIIKLCIERYYEVFDEIRDRTEPLRTYRAQPRSLSHARGSSTSSRPISTDEESIDDAMLVMPIGPSRNSISMSASSSGSGPSAVGSAPRPWAYQPRKRPGARSMHSVGAQSQNAYNFGTADRARSVMVSIDKGDTSLNKGSISFGRTGTMRKSPGAGVEAVGITAAGFFAPPEGALSASGGEGSMDPASYAD
ncbi:Rho GTPase activation protein [Fistulina hepatica ATCC 64428]|uniref:Rho GTPase activation protein n=1 Tax=Fistulina hepatica ATCC 64428 TaxID=1128425 RepID=A0A0D7AHM0_9AGAR|nr:Rho GTPase activation protein [Fistulina hepatica ATCC 64428]